jgi:hypothetical protein
MRYSCCALRSILVTDYPGIVTVKVTGTSQSVAVT